MNPQTLHYLVAFDVTPRVSESARQRAVHLNGFRSPSRSQRATNSRRSR